MPNGVVDKFTYDNMNRLTKETEDGPGNTPIAEYDYTYRLDGLVATESDDFWFANNGQNVEVTNNITYSYDALDRLIDEAFVTNAEQILGFDPSLPQGVRQWETFDDEYTYDLDSNQVRKTTQLGADQTVDETVTSTYDANDRLLEQVDATARGSTTTQYSYNNTEQTAQTVYLGTPNALGTVQSSQQYQYDLQGRMSLATVTTYANGIASRIEQLTYGYDDNGTRVSALDRIGTTPGGPWSSQTLTEYVNDSNNFTGYSQVLRQTQSDPTSGQVQKVTEYAIGLRQISQTTTVYTNGQPGAPSTLYFGYDGHGSVRVLMNAAGGIATVAGVRQVFNYDAYGNAIGFNTNAAGTSLLYSGQQTDVATGLQYLRARYYNPGAGVFTSLDSYSGNQSSPVSYNKYLYTQGNPIGGVDPTGNNDLVEGLITVGVIGGLASVFANGLFNVSQRQPFLANAGSAFICGAGLSVAAVLCPAFGVLLAAAGLASAWDNWLQVFNSPDWTWTQMFSASALLGLSFFGALGASRYAASQSLASSKGSLLWNLDGLTNANWSNTYGQFKSAVGTAYTAMRAIENLDPKQLFGKNCPAIGLLFDPATRSFKIVAFNNGSGTLPEAARNALPPGVDMPVAPRETAKWLTDPDTDTIHGESYVIAYARENGLRVIGIGSRWIICKNCVTNILDAGGGFLSRTHFDDPLLAPLEAFFGQLGFLDPDVAATAAAGGAGGGAPAGGIEEN